MKKKKSNLTEADENRKQEQTLDLQEVNKQEESNDELNKELKRFLIPKLRSASYRWKFRSEAIKKARKSRGLYECEICKAELKNGEYVLDHREPVVPLSGWDGLDWNVYIARMFVKTEGFQVICNPCHDIKTDTEVAIRKMHREKKKQAKKA